MVKRNIRGSVLKKILFISIVFYSFSAYSQSNDYIERIRLVEKFANENQIKLGKIAPEKLAEIMRFAGGLAANTQHATEIQNRISELDTYIKNTKLAGVLAKAITIPTALHPYLDPKSREFLANLINKNSKDPTPQNFLASQISKYRKIQFIISELVKELQKIATRPARPTSPTSLSLKRIFKRTTTVQKMRLPKPSGDFDYLSNSYMALNYGYTEYEDETIGTSGQIHDWSMSLHGTIFENTDLSFGFVANEAEANGSISNDFRSQTVGGDVMIHHKLTENYGLGVYGFYQHSDYEMIETRDYGAGYGFLFSTWHDFNYFELSTVTSWTKTYYEAGNDTLFNGAVEITRFWTDRFSTSLRAAYTDSLDNDVAGDNSYWTLGGSIGYMLTDKIHLSVGYNTDKSIKDYESETWNFGIAYYF